MAELTVRFAIPDIERAGTETDVLFEASVALQLI